MLAHLQRLPFALDPLMAEAKRRARQRRFLIAVVVLVLVGGAAGAVAAFHSPQGPTSLPPALGGGSAQTSGTALADFPRLGLSFRYPAGWRRFGCQYETLGGTMSVTYLTAAARRPRCLGGGVVPRRLSPNGVAILWQQQPLSILSANARLGGQPSRVDVWSAHAAPFGDCAAAGGQRVIAAGINEPATANTGFEVVACLRGPKLRQSQAAVGQMLASVRFHPRVATQ